MKQGRIILLFILILCLVNILGNFTLGLTYSIGCNTPVTIFNNLNFLVMSIALPVTLPITFCFIFYDKLESIISSSAKKNNNKSCIESEETIIMKGEEIGRILKPKNYRGDLDAEKKEHYTEYRLKDRIKIEREGCCEEEYYVFTIKFFNNTHYDLINVILKIEKYPKDSLHLFEQNIQYYSRMEQGTILESTFKFLIREISLRGTIYSTVSFKDNVNHSYKIEIEPYEIAEK